MQLWLTNVSGGLRFSQGPVFTCNIHIVNSDCQPGGQLPFFFFVLHDDIMENKQEKPNAHKCSRFPFSLYLCLSLFLLFVSHFSFVFCLICLSISNCLPPRGLWATTLTAIWPTTTSGWEGAPEAPAG